MGSIEELKSSLRSLVVSSPARMDAAALARDYRLMMGEHIPAARYGYRDYVTFLREKCSDCFLFSGPFGNPVLTLIVSDTLKHIDGFVQKQKISASAKFKGKRRSVPESMIRSQDTYQTSNGTCSIKPNQNYKPPTTTYMPPTNTYKPPTTTYKPPRAIYKSPTTAYTPPTTTYTPPTTAYTPPTTTYTPPTTTYKPPSITYQPPTTERNINSSHNMQRLQEAKPLTNLTQSVNNLHIQREEENQTVIGTGGSHTDVQKFLFKKLHGSTIHFDVETKDDDSGRHTLSSGGLSSKQALLEDLRLEMKVLIAEHPHGIWSADLMRLYEARFGRSLPLSRVGYSNVVSLTRALGGVLRVARPERTGDWLLLPVGAPEPPCTGGLLQPVQPVQPVQPAAHRHREPPQDPDDALPGVPFESSVFPEDCLHFVESIPPPAPPDIVKGGTLPVMVGEVYSPSHLWLLRVGPEHLGAMENIMDEMNQYYGCGEGRSRTLEAGAVRVGHYCAAIFEQEWHRAIIVKLLDSDTVKVRYVDYGTVGRCAASALRPLLRRWAALPAQAVRARLAAVRPVGGTRHWPHAAARKLLSLVAQRPLVAQLVAQDPEEGILEVFLVDTRGDEDLCINDELVAGGHADTRQDSALASGEWYLFPSFEALEGGCTPNLDDIEHYMAVGVQPRHVGDYRRHVPLDEPPPAPLPPLPPPPPPPERHVWVPALELDVYRALATHSPAMAARHMTASLARAGAQPAAGAQPVAGAVRLRALDAEVFTRLCAAEPAALTAHRFLAALLPPLPAAPAAPAAPALNPRAAEFRSLHY